jgi:hypothetical protein
MKPIRVVAFALVLSTTGTAFADDSCDAVCQGLRVLKHANDLDTAYEQATHPAPRATPSATPSPSPSASPSASTSAMSADDAEMSYWKRATARLHELLK